MTFEEVYQEYIKVFKVLVKYAGDQTGNPVYKNIEELLNRDRAKTAIRNAIDSEVELPIFISVLLTEILFDVHGLDKLSDMELEETGHLISDFYKRYLQDATEKFCSKNGLPQPDPDLGIGMKIIRTRVRKTNT